MKNRLSSLLALALVVALLSGSAPPVLAESLEVWESPGGGVGGQVNALLPDGDGGVYLGGEFNMTGPVETNYWASFEGGEWQNDLDGFDEPVYASLLDPHSGKLYVGGNFTQAGQASASGIAWTSESVTGWQPLAGGVNGRVMGMIADAGGNLYVAGNFTSAGGVAGTRLLAMWDGSQWSSVGGGLTGSIARSLTLDSSGNLYVGGTFYKAGGVDVSNIAMWDGSQWHTLEGGVGSPVYDLVYSPSGGRLFAGGDFQSAGLEEADPVDVSYVAAWDGSQWMDVGGGVPSYVNTLAYDEARGYLYVGGEFSEADYIQRWDGSQWSEVAGGMDGSIWELVLAADGRLYAGGDFHKAGEANALGIAWYDPANPGWEPVDAGFDDAVHTMILDSEGNLAFAGGKFTFAGGEISRGIAHWDGSDWVSMQAGLDGVVFALAMDKDGNLYAGGNFSQAGTAGVTALNLAMWDGSQWQALEGGTGGTVYALAFDKDDRLVAGGEFPAAGGAEAHNLAVWEPSTQEWSTMDGTDGPVYALAFRNGVDLFIGGDFSTIGEANVRNLASNLSAVWVDLGGTDGPVYSLLFDNQDRLLVGGAFSSAGGLASDYIARYDGDAWQSLGELDGPVHSLGIDAGSAVLMAGGEFSGSLAGWDSMQGQWVPVASEPMGIVRAVAPDQYGNLWIGGSFSQVGDLEVKNFARRPAGQDVTPPTSPQVTASPSGWTNAGSVTITASGSSDSESGLDGYQYRATGQAWQDVPPDGVIVTTEGETCYYFRAIDRAGNPSAASGLVCARIDRTAPVTNNVVLSETHGLADNVCQTGVSQPSFSWTGAADSLSGLAGQYIYFGLQPAGTAEAFQAGSSFSYQATSTGLYYLRLRFKDQAGNLSPWKTTFRFCYLAGAGENVVTPENGGQLLQTLEGVIFSLIFPPQSVNEPLVVTLGSAALPAAPQAAPPEGTEMIGPAFTVSAASADDGQPASETILAYTTTISFPDGALGEMDPDSIHLYYHDPVQENWILYETDVEQDSLSSATSKFGTFAVFGSPKQQVTGSYIYIPIVRR